MYLGLPVFEEEYETANAQEDHRFKSLESFLMARNDTENQAGVPSRMRGAI